MAKWEAKTRRRGAEEDEPGGDLGRDGGAHPMRPGSPHAFPSSRSAIGLPFLLGEPGPGPTPGESVL